MKAFGMVRTAGVEGIGKRDSKIGVYETHDGDRGILCMEASPFLSSDSVVELILSVLDSKCVFGHGTLALTPA